MSLTSDFGAAAGMLLFTGAEAVGDGSMLEIISKFGVIAVLWFWLRDLKKESVNQAERFDSKITELTKAFEDETDEVRESYDKMISKMSEDHQSHTAKLEQMISEQTEHTKDLYEKIYNMNNNNNK